MGIKISPKHIVLDLSQSRHIMIQASQYDVDSRELIIHVTNDGEFFAVPQNYQASIEYKKADDTVGVVDCEILSDGTLSFTITEQMTAVAGYCKCDLMIVSNKNAINTSAFIINVKESVITGDEIKSKDDFTSLTRTVIKAKSAITTMTQMQESFSDYIDESTEKIDYCIEQAEKAQAIAEQNVQEAEASANAANSSAIAANKSANLAAEKAEEMVDYADQSKSYAIGTNDEYRAGDSTDNAKYYYEQTKNISLDITKSNGYECINSKPGGYRLLDLEGATEQKQLSGKNLLDLVTEKSSNVRSVQYTVKNGVLTTNGTANAAGGRTDYITTVKLQAGVYSFHAFDYTGKVSDTLCLSNVADGTAIIASMGSFTLQEETTVGFGLNFLSGVTYSGSTKIQLEAGSVKTEYEEFCGGTPSPNSSFSQAIENTFACVEMIQGCYSAASGDYQNTTVAVCPKHHIPCKAGDVIKVQTHKGVKGNHYYFFYSGNNYVTYLSSIDTLKSEKTVPSGVDSFTFHISNSNGLTPQTVGKISLTVNGKYVGQIVEHNDNLFVKSDAIVGKGIGTTGGYYDSEDMTCSDFFEVEAGESYIGTKVAWWTFYTETRTFISQGSTVPVKAPSNAKYCRLSVLKKYLDVAQFEKGTVATEYKEGKLKVTTFFLNEPLRATDIMLRENDLIKVERNRYKLVLDGTESYSNDGVYGGRYIYAINVYYILTKKIKFENGFLCTHYKTFVEYYTNGLEYGVYYGGAINDTGWLEFATNFTTLAEFKAFVAEQYANGTPITIEFTVNKPTYETLDAESQIAINDMETFDGVTYIEVDSKTPPTSISGEYGTSQVGAYTLKCMNDNDTDRVERAEMKARLDELAVALVSQ